MSMQGSPVQTAGQLPVARRGAGPHSGCRALHHPGSCAAPAGR